MKPLHVFLLGSFRLERDTQTIHLPTRKVESLLAYLALHPEPHAREKLAALCWGDSTDELARRSLRTALSTLRKELSDDIVLADRETVQLNPDFPIWVDAREIADCRLQIADLNAQSEIINLKSEIDLLPDFYDDWILPERERLRAIYIDALLQLAQHHRAESEYTRAIEFAQKILVADPANEKAYQHIIFCLAATGDRIGALKQYDECKKILRDELGVEPSSETIALRDRIEQALSGGKAREALFTNLPHPLTSFIGREKEIVEVKQLLAQHRLVTLTGSGGCGKTRLAIEVASQLVESFRNGVWWVELAPLSDASLIPQTVAQALGLRETPNQSLDETLNHFLRGKRLLLVLDNCEHLIVACAELANKLLSACVELKILATSRESLGITGEVAWRVPSFAVPDVEQLPSLEKLVQYDVIQLFVQRAMTVAPQWRLNGNAPSVARVCARLDGIPLAIELAAARVKVLSVEQIAARLDDRFNLLTTGSRAALARQQTLRATIDWSYDLLSDAERIMLQRLSVFAGGWTLEAAEEVCNGQSTTLDTLASLVDKSLVVVEQNEAEPRYHMLETVRQYAHEKFAQAESSELESVRTRHLDYFLKLAEEAEPKLQSAEQKVWLVRLENDYDNLRAAWERAIETDAEIALRLVWALFEFWGAGVHLPEARDWLASLLPRTERWGVSAKHARVLIIAGAVALYQGNSAAARELIEQGLTIAKKTESKFEIACACLWLGFSTWIRGDFQTAHDVLDTSLVLWRELDDALYIARTQFFLANVMRDQGEFDQAHQLYEASIARFQALGDNRHLAHVLNALGVLAQLQGDYPRAAKWYEECIKFERENGRESFLVLAIGNLGTVSLHASDYPRARACFEESLILEQQLGHTEEIFLNLMGLAGVMTATGKPEQAALLLGFVEATVNDANIILQPADRIEYDYIWASVRAKLDEATFEKARLEGRTMTLEQAVEYALNEIRVTQDLDKQSQ
ncbi:MAG: tetratricopeptide repeat protein [Chloroflexi bacterium]|nr:tetratricopeptide repeat protein [Chloroflexota bacterium]